MIQAWVMLEPLASLPILKNIRTAKAIYKDVNGNPLTETFLDKDEMGTPIMKQRPIIQSMGWFYAPKYWKHYDDLHKNITDDKKLAKFYQSIADDWIGESQEEETKRGKYLDIFRKVFKKGDSYNLDSLDKQEAIDPKETSKKTIL